MAAVHHLRFLEIQNFDQQGLTSVKMCHQPIAELWQFNDFSKWWPSTTLDFQNEFLTVSTVQRVNMHHHAKFCADWSNHC